MTAALDTYSLRDAFVTYKSISNAGNLYYVIFGCSVKEIKTV